MSRKHSTRPEPRHERSGATPGGQSPRSRSLKAVDLTGWIVAILLTLLLVTAHVMRLRYAGGLWRDEVNSVNVATRPSFAETWACARWDSFPFGWAMITRIWHLLGIGQTNAGWRLWGMLMGVSILAVLWWVAKVFGHNRPVCSLLFVGASPMVIVFGDAVRAYGLGLVLMFCTMALVWKVLERATWVRCIAAALVAAFSVNVVYYNAILLFAMCLAGAAVCLRRRDWRRLAVLFSIGLFALASLIVVSWRHFTSSTEWNDMVKTPVPFGWLFKKFAETVNSSCEFMIWVWIVVAILSVAYCIFRCTRRGPDDSSQDRDLALFAATAIISGLVLYFFFLKVVSYPTQAWYYLSILGFTGVLFDVALGIAVPANLVGGGLRIALMLAIAGITASNVWQAVHFRMTNIDLVAEQLNAAVTKDDFIVVNVYYAAISFNRYYHGPAPWASIPDIEDHLVHRYDQVRDKMIHQPVTPVMEQVARTLQSGHRVYLVGALEFIPPDMLQKGWKPRRLPPPPLPETGWNDAPYLAIWSQQVAFAVETNAVSFKQVPVPVAGPVNGFENEPLLVAEGPRPR